VQVISGNIETVIASPGGSDLSAGFGNATLIGGPGNDVLAAGTAPPGTTQTLIGGGGTDTLVGGIGHDVLIGGNQPVTFQPGQGSDTLTSPVAGNTLSYASATSGVQANLSTQVVTVPAGKPFAGTVLAPQTATGGFPGSSVDLSGASINHLVGTSLTDIFVTSGSNDTIAGGGGSDLFIMLNGNNTVSEPSGSSPTFLFAGAGSNIINGGGNGTVDFSDPGTPARVIVNLQAGTATGGFGGTQSFSGIKSVIGTSRTFNDILVAGPPGGVLIGSGTGSDVLQAGPSGDNLLIGGNGNTTFCSESACAVSGTSTGGGANAGLANHMVGGSGDDTFFVRNNAYDSINGGGGFNAARMDSTKDTAVNIQSSCDTAGCTP
jgi:Ca2+-binding RTX toxin-like protein